MNDILGFGERIDGCRVRALNERTVRAGAGIVFLFAIVSFMNAWLTGNFQPTRVFVVAFLFNFTIRIFINPRYTPSLVVGHWFVRKQLPDYVGAPQKRFAWAIGFVLALAMLYLVVLNNVIGPINLIVCATCLLLFFESAFGICVGCKVYYLFSKEHAQLCPGSVCAVSAETGSDGNLAQGVVLVAFVGLVGMTALWVAGHNPQAVPLQASATSTPQTPVDPAEAERCKVPEFAKALSHEEQWKLHNNCQ